jgi:hypothetical protein
MKKLTDLKARIAPAEQHRRKVMTEVRLLPCPLVVGEKVTVDADACPAEWREDWRGVEAWITGISVAPEMPNGFNIEISEVLPPSNGDRTDGFDVAWLSPHDTRATPAAPALLEDSEEPCEHGQHCCFCSHYEPCCDCGLVMPSKACIGEKCWCGEPAAKKVGEEILFDDPNPARHNLTAYVCAAHYAQMMGPLGAQQVGIAARTAISLATPVEKGEV